MHAQRCQSGADRLTGLGLVGTDLAGEDHSVDPVKADGGLDEALAGPETEHLERQASTVVRVGRGGDQFPGV